MLIGPLKPPQISRVPLADKSEGKDQPSNDEVLQTLHLPYCNCLVVLTKWKVLIYNYKPMALVSSFKRSQNSIESYGESKKLYADSANTNLFEGVMKQTDLRYVGSQKGKVTFYMVSSTNFVFVFQLLLNSNPVSTFKEVGIPIIDINKIDHDFGQELMNDVEDDETLTVFDKNDSHRVIQNGYAVEKQRGFLQFLTRTSDTVDEIPIKRMELRLKVMFNFGRTILDLAGICEPNTGDEVSKREHMMILLPHRVHIMKFQDFKVQDNIFIDISDGIRLLYVKESACVISQTAELQVYLNYIDIGQKNVTTQKLSVQKEELLQDVLINGNILSLVYESDVIIYDLEKDFVIKRVTTRTKLSCFGQIRDDAKLLVTGQGFKLLTNRGSCIVSTMDDDDTTSEEHEVSLFTSFAAVGGSLVMSSPDGQLSRWDLWFEMPSSFTDVRYTKPLILLNDNNDILIFAPTSDSSANIPFQTLKLPTQTINNCISLIKANGPLTMLAVLVSNKNILLIHNMVENTWHSFSDLALVDMWWLGNDYLFCHSLDEDMNEQLRCYHFPADKGFSSDIREQLIWEHAISAKTSLRSIHVNTLSRYKLLRLKSKNQSYSSAENMFKTAEILIQSDEDLRTIDVISKVNADETVNIKVFHQHPAEKMFDGRKDACNWILSVNGGYLAQCRDEIIKWERVDERGWLFCVVLAGVERTLDVVETDIYLIKDNEVVIYSLEDLWESQAPMATVEMAEGDYPAVISPDAAIIHSIQFVLAREVWKLIPRQAIYLDQLIEHHLAAGVSCQEIDARYRSLLHYKFSLEKILSGKVLTNDSLVNIISLIEFYDQGPKHSGRLEIISNCLRKIEIEHWDYLFTKLKLTPRDLLLQCIEQDEARVLGVLLMVFLNYDVSKKSRTAHASPSSKQDSKEGDMNKGALEKGSVSTVLNDEDLMLQVLRLLVHTAAASEVREEAREFWDMSFQLVRFIHALDNENHTSLIQRAIEIIG
ncbi:LADA_0E02212g1_1 [Lachancea dasiensis]|uniref:LADA_0E02212g1_1 n=1 Tax=Lachancea dasiensis TaxID=1072105 RepID=A0A1G4JAP5_9SACH|nr:LADA_0E02212g1_1 [Lachancea dasiensis]